LRVEVDRVVQGEVDRLTSEIDATCGPNDRPVSQPL
jgi:hypothetical protein